MKVGGILLEAGPSSRPPCCRSAKPAAAASHAANPTFLYDIFARAGGASAGRADCFVTINSNNVVGDNFWLWRADHGAGAGWDATRTATA